MVPEIHVGFNRISASSVGSHWREEFHSTDLENRGSSYSNPGRNARLTIVYPVFGFSKNLWRKKL